MLIDCTQTNPGTETLPLCSSYFAYVEALNFTPYETISA
jgi:hypothetical protein